MSDLTDLIRALNEFAEETAEFAEALPNDFGVRNPGLIDSDS